MICWTIRPLSYPQRWRTVIYYLQYHLYTVALHRFLAQRQPGYRYDKHFGGVLYLFLKGMQALQWAA